MATIRKREGKNGVSYQIDYFDPNGKRVRQSFKKKKDAEAELGKRVSLIAEKRYLDVKKDYKTTFGELLDNYEENFQHQATFTNSKRAYLKNFRQYFNELTLLANIRFVDLESYRNHLKQKPIMGGGIRKESTVNREMACLHHVFAKAVEWEMIEQNPFDRGKSLRLKENNKRLRYLSEEEIQRLLAECPKYLRRIVECGIHTGMRKSEILRLRWDQIKNGCIYLEAEDTKTKEPRQVPINDHLRALLKEIRAERPVGIKYVFVFRRGEHRVKTGKRCRILNPIPERVKDVKTAFQNALKRACIDDFRFHDLRHTFASQLVMKGGTLKEVQEILGHASMTMTMRYAHLSQEKKREAVNLLNGLTGKTCHKMSQNTILSAH